jgi:hypothetical protein
VSSADPLRLSVSQGIGRPLIGLASDRFGRINVAAIGTLIAGLAAYFLWIFAGTHFPGLIVYALFGGFAGIIWPCVAPVGAEVVGLQLLPAGMNPYPENYQWARRLTYTPALSIYWLVLVLPATLYVKRPVPLSSVRLQIANFRASAEVIALSLRTSGIGAYLDVQVFTGTMYIASFLSCMTPVPPCVTRPCSNTVSSMAPEKLETATVGAPGFGWQAGDSSHNTGIWTSTCLSIRHDRHQAGLRSNGAMQIVL